MPSRDRSRTQRQQRARQIVEEESIAKQPHSIVICRGKTGKNLNDLMMDFRNVMSPFTASNLKVKKANVLKDFLTIAGPMNVKHLVTFSKTRETVGMRLITVPKGPTMSFAIDEFALKKDVESSLQRPIKDQKVLKNPPLLIMSQFPNQTDVEKFTYEAFRALFPRIKPSQVAVDTIRRVVLLHYNKETNQIQFRHYAIKTRTGAGKRVRKLLENGKSVPDLGKYESVEQFLNGMSGSESEFDDSSEVTNPKSGRQMKVRLTELGPRMNLRLVKIEEGLSGGAVLYHSYKNKTEEEKMQMEEKIGKAVEDKQERIRLQNQNVAAKKAAQDKKKKNEEKKKRKDEAATKARVEHIEQLRDGKGEKHGKSLGRKRGAGPKGPQGPKKKLTKKAKSNML